jgi:hypothetical protein
MSRSRAFYCICDTCSVTTSTSSRPEPTQAFASYSSCDVLRSRMTPRQEKEVLNAIRAAVCAHGQKAMGYYEYDSDPRFTVG